MAYDKVLHAAASGGHVKVVELLRERGASPNGVGALKAALRSGLADT